MFKVIMS